MEPPKTARLAITTIFFFHGLIFGNWVTRIPEVKLKLGLSEFDLGLLLFAISAGLIVSISFTGGMVARFGSKAVTIGAVFAASIVLILMAIGSTFVEMWIILFFYGSAMTFMDVAMNAQALEIERQYGRPIIASFHAAYSIAGFVGASYGGLLIDLGVSAVLHFLTISIVVILGSLLLQSNFVEDRDTIGEKSPVFTLPPLALLPLGIIGLLSSIGEGAMADWTGVYLNQYIGIDIARSTWGFAAFSITMTLGRLTGDKVTGKISKRRTLQLSGIIAAFGLFLAMITNYFALIVIGFGFVGLGLSVIIPIVFSAAGNKEGYNSGIGIASVATIGYLGFLIGPPLVGFFAELTSLVDVFWGIGLLMLVIPILASFAIDH